MIIQNAIIGNTRPCSKWYKGGLIVMNLNSQIKVVIIKQNKYELTIIVCILLVLQKRC